MLRVGMYKIIAPDVPNLRFEDGREQASLIDDNLIDAVIKKRAKIAVLFPDHFVQYEQGQEGPKVYADYFVGLLEGALEKIRDCEFPELRTQANRDQIRDVSVMPTDFSEAVDGVFHTAWKTYDPLENFISGRIAVGILQKDGNYILVESRECDIASSSFADENARTLSYHVGNKFFKALDCMYSSNLRARYYLSGYADGAPKNSVDMNFC